MAEFQALLALVSGQRHLPEADASRSGCSTTKRVAWSAPASTRRRTSPRLAAPAAAGSTNVKIVARTGVGFAAGETLLIDPFGTGRRSPSRRSARRAPPARASRSRRRWCPTTSPAPAVGRCRRHRRADPRRPQGQYVMVANMDQNGIEYPARHFGTDHYLNNIVGGGVGPWYTNINAIPLYTTPNNLYDATAIQRIQNNLAAAQAFRTATANAVSEAFQVLGRSTASVCRWKTRCASTRSARRRSTRSAQSVPAYLPSDIPKYSPVVDDNTGRTDQVSFIRDWGFPGTASSAPSTPAQIRRSAATKTRIQTPTRPSRRSASTRCYDTNDDTCEHLNYYASGTTHGPGGPSSPSEGLKRALELPATWTSYVVAGDAVRRGRGRGAASRSRTSRPCRPSRS